MVTEPRTVGGTPEPAATPSGAPRRGSGRPLFATQRWTRIQSYLLVVPAIVFLVLFLFYPLTSNIYLSFQDVGFANFRTGDRPFVGLSNYANVLNDDVFRQSIGLTLLFVGGSLAGQFTIGFALAVFFNRAFPGHRLLRALILLGWLMPMVVSASIFRWMLDGDLGVINHLLMSVGLLDGPRHWLTDPSTAIWGVIVANIWIGIPFNMLLLLAGLQGIPQVLYEAGSVDGASSWQRFWHITWPLMRPVSLTVLVLGLVFTFKVFDLILIMTAGGPVNATTIMTVYVYQVTFDFFRFGEGAAAAVLLMLIPLLFAIGYVRVTRSEETL
jgi:multiple sugar transport system permease protein